MGRIIKLNVVSENDKAVAEARNFNVDDMVNIRPVSGGVEFQYPKGAPFTKKLVVSETLNNIAALSAYDSQGYIS